MSNITRRGVLSVLGALAATFGLARRANASDPEHEYWEVVYRCPQGHEYITLVAKYAFDPLDPPKHTSYCGLCESEWLAKCFPPPVYDCYRPDSGKRDTAPRWR